MLEDCKVCSGVGKLYKKFLFYKWTNPCKACSGTGLVFSGDDHPSKKGIDGDPQKMQEVFHIMAEARDLAFEANAKGKRTFDIHDHLKKAQTLLREQDYDKALDHAKKALIRAKEIAPLKT